MDDFFIDPHKDRMKYLKESQKAEQAMFEVNRREKDAENKQRQDITRLAEVTEKQSIEIKRLVEITRKQGKSSSNLSKWSLVFSIMAVLFAAGAVFFSFIDFKGDALWQKQQIEVLTDIKESVVPLEKSIVGIDHTAE